MHGCIFFYVASHRFFFFFCMKEFDVTQNGLFEDLKTTTFASQCSHLCEYTCVEKFALGDVHGAHFISGYLTVIMWVLGLGLSWGEWRWRSGALLHLF